MRLPPHHQYKIASVFHVGNPGLIKRHGSAILGTMAHLLSGCSHTQSQGPLSSIMFCQKWSRGFCHPSVRHALRAATHTLVCVLHSEVSDATSSWGQCIFVSTMTTYVSVYAEV